MDSYAGRIQNALRQTTAAAQAKLPTVSFVDTTSAGGFLTTIAPYIIWALIAVFLIMLILVVIHYTVYPIFNFGDNPAALLNLSSPAAFDRSWFDENTNYTDAVGVATLPRADYTVLFDFKVIKNLPSASTKNDFILAYKSLVNTPKTVGAFTLPLTSVSTDPSMVITFNSLSSKVVVYFLAQSKADTTQKFSDFVSADVPQGVPLRLALTVSDSIIELYLNGKYAASKVLTGKSIVAGDTEYILSPPTAFANNIVVKNLFTTPRVITSGEVLTMGTPALK
jgi:hypothetical protein